MPLRFFVRKSPLGVHQQNQEKQRFTYPVLRSKPQRWIPELRCGYPPLRKTFCFFFFCGSPSASSVFFFLTFNKVFWEPFGLWTSAPEIVDVHTKTLYFPAAPAPGRNFLTPGHLDVRVRNVLRKFGPKDVGDDVVLLVWPPVKMYLSVQILGGEKLL